MLVSKRTEGRGQALGGWCVCEGARSWGAFLFPCSLTLALPLSGNHWCYELIMGSIQGAAHDFVVMGLEVFRASFRDKAPSGLNARPTAPRRAWGKLVQGLRVKEEGEEGSSQTSASGHPPRVRRGVLTR